MEQQKQPPTHNQWSVAFAFYSKGRDREPHQRLHIESLSSQSGTRSCRLPLSLVTSSTALHELGCCGPSAATRTLQPRSAIEIASDRLLSVLERGSGLEMPQ